MTEELIDLTGVSRCAATCSTRATPTARSARWSSGELHRVRHGSYCDATLWRSLDAPTGTACWHERAGRAHPTTATTCRRRSSRRSPCWAACARSTPPAPTGGRRDAIACSTPAPCRRRRHGGQWRPVSLASEALRDDDDLDVERASSPSTALARTPRLTTSRRQPARASPRRAHQPTRLVLRSATPARVCGRVARCHFCYVAGLPALTQVRRRVGRELGASTRLSSSGSSSIDGTTTVRRPRRARRSRVLMREKTARGRDRQLTGSATRPVDRGPARRRRRRRASMPRRLRVGDAEFRHGQGGQAGVAHGPTSRRCRHCGRDRASSPHPCVCCPTPDRRATVEA